MKSTSQNQENQISRYLTVQGRIEILIGLEFRGISWYKFILRFVFNLNLQLTKISPPCRISIWISFTISSLIFQGTGCMSPGSPDCLGRLRRRHTPAYESPTQIRLIFWVSNESLPKSRLLTILSPCSYAVAKAHRLPYFQRSFSRKEPYDYN